MLRRVKVGRNSPCPCGRLLKYKQCCEGKVDWEQVFRTGADWRRYLSVRGRNLYFANGLAKILQLDTRSVNSLKDYKAAFTADVVRRIYELVLEIWPPDLNIAGVLTADSEDVSGLYIGDYDDIEYVTRGIVRHSIYANRILVVDPFIYPRSVRDEFNPIIEPEQHRAQTLKNANFWFTLLPWIEAGIVEIIRTPADFDPQLNWDSMKRQRKKFSENKELRAAAEISVKEMSKRHEVQINRHLLLSAPDSYIENTIRELGLEKNGHTAKDFLQYIEAEREQDPNFLEPLVSKGGQLRMFSSGANYEIAQLTANLTRSYLVTDMYVRWREIELDRESHNAASKMWSPFAKALQESPLRYLNGVRLEHAFRLRQDGRLESLRSFFVRVWKSARTEDVFDSVNAQTLAEELREEIANAKNEWKEIDRDLVKIVGAELATGLLAAGSLVAEGNAHFLAAAVGVTGAATLLNSRWRRKSFPERFPAAFFMNIEEDK
jgi:hypothetical protein